MKKIITLLLVLTGMVSTVSADNWYVVGDPAGGWSPRPVANSKAVTMTASSSISGIYYYDYTSTGTSDVYFAIANGDASSDSDWSGFNSSHRWANSTSNYPLDGSNDYDIATTNGDLSFKLTPSAASVTYRIVFNATDKKLSCVKLDTYVVAGCFRPGNNVWYEGADEASCYGTAWDNTNTSNEMTLQDNGIYVKSFSDVQLTGEGYFMYRAVVENSEGGNPQNYYISSGYTFDIEIEKKVGVTETVTLTECAITDYYVVGGLGTAGWTVSSTAMSEESGVYSVEFSMPSASNYYRFALAPNTVIKDGNVFNWNCLVRPSCGGNWDWILDTFVNISNYEVQRVETNGNAWQFPASMGECDWAFSYNSSTDRWSVYPSFKRTINASAGYATFSFAHNVAIPGVVDAYYGKEVTDGKIVMKKFTDGIPANTGALLAGSGQVTFTPAASTPTAPATNLLKASVTDTELTGNSTSPYYYILGGTSAETVGFYYVNITRNSGAGKAYLETATALASEGTNARAAWIFDDEITGINEVKEVKANNAYYNLAGQRIAQPTKGLYIVNGKKVIMK